MISVKSLNSGLSFYNSGKLYAFALFLMLFFCIVFASTAQKEKNIWYFGYQAGLDFSSGNPVALTNSAMTTAEAAAVMNDSTGILLFYTNSTTVWNANNQEMENGDSLMGCPSATQVLIVPKPGVEDSLYYIFTVGCVEYNLFANGLRYSVVDLKYNNGLGKVVEKNILLKDTVTEKLTAITHANGYDFWVLAHEWGNNNFLEYKITCNGLDTIPNIISIGQALMTYHNNYGLLKSSLNGQKLAMAAGMILELYDFNALNGNITNFVSFPNDSTGGGTRYGIIFSPDNNKLYLNRSGYPGADIWQYNLLAGTPTDIIASQILIFDDTISSAQMFLNFGAMELAADGKIYQAHYTLGNGMGDTLLGVINYPDSLGLSCAYNHFDFNLNGKNSNLSLPNFIETPYSYIKCNVYVEEQNFSDSIHIYPNPCSNLLVIEISESLNMFKGKTFDFFNVIGQKIEIGKSYSIFNNDKIIVKINCSGMPDGIYFFGIHSTDKNIFKKVIINH